jgi:hypothetical protein
VGRRARRRARARKGWANQRKPEGARPMSSDLDAAYRAGGGVTNHQKTRLRGACKTNAERTHCAHGHEFDESNTYWWQGNRRHPRRMCRRCNADRAAARAAAKNPKK